MELVKSFKTIQRDQKTHSKSIQPVCIKLEKYLVNRKICQELKVKTTTNLADYEVNTAPQVETEV